MPPVTEREREEEKVRDRISQTLKLRNLAFKVLQRTFLKSKIHHTEENPEFTLIYFIILKVKITNYYC
jgi:hypothetical protein